ncbi:MAG: NAD(P)/FAD-dependent oxidoreductase [Clostridia bacterium]|nr:NAD(P)/FAD-dependent oxidoreductase [Clostridia bacterium]
MGNIVVIGAGAAGLIAAGKALSLGKKVTILEKNPRPARKVMITGKGRCNVTNACSNQDFLEAVVSNRRFLYSAINQFSPYDAMDLFDQELGVPLKTERGNRVFPISDKAVDIVDALANYAKKATILYNTACQRILVENQRVVGVVTEAGETIEASSVIVATGGVTYPATGSTGDGFIFAQNLGHTVTPLTPSLVPLVCHSTVCRDLMGLSLRNVTVHIKDKATDKIVFTELGEMLFTHFGVSGPLILSASVHLRPMEPNRYMCSIDMKPGLNEAQLDARILRDFQENLHKTLRNSLGKLLPSKMIPVMIKRVGISPDIKVHQITKEQRHSLVNGIKNFTLNIFGFRPIDEAVVTAGGVSVDEINPKTMESKLISHLYFAGEVLDVDAYTGGYNLQIAFATGNAAGIAAI